MKTVLDRGVLAKALLLGAMLTVPGAAYSQAGAQGPKPSHYVKYRKGVFTLIRWNFAPMAAVVKGEAPYDRARFATQAARIAALAPMITEGFDPSTKGAKGTEAKDEIYGELAEFNRLAKDLETKANALAKAAQGGDLAQIRPAFAAAGKACGACHDRFKAD